MYKKHLKAAVASVVRSDKAKVISAGSSIIVSMSLAKVLAEGKRKMIRQKGLAGAQ